MDYSPYIATNSKRKNTTKQPNKVSNIMKNIIYKVEIIVTEGYNTKRTFKKVSEYTDTAIFTTFEAAQEYATGEFLQKGGVHKCSYEAYENKESKTYTSTHIWIIELDATEGTEYLYSRHMASASTWDFIHPDFTTSRGLLNQPEYW